MVAASSSPRPAGADDSTLGVAHPSRGRGRGGGRGRARGGRGQPRPLGPACPVRRPRLHGSSSDVGASGDLPGSRPPALPALTADERLRRRREIRQGKRTVADFPGYGFARTSPAFPRLRSRRASFI